MVVATKFWHRGIGGLDFFKGESLPLTAGLQSVRTPSAEAGRPRDAPDIVRD